MKKVLIGVIIAAVVAVGGVAIYTNSSSASKASSSASPNATTSAGVIAATNNNDNSTATNDKTKSDATAKVDATKQQTNNAAVTSKVVTTQAAQTTQTTDPTKAPVTSATGATTVDTTKASNASKSAASSASIATNVEHTQDTAAKATQKVDSSKASTATTTTLAVGPNQINPGTGNFSALNSYPFMVATLSNGQQIIIPIKTAQKDGSLLVTNGYYTNNIHTPVQFKISSLGNGAYNFYQMQGGSILSDLSVVSQGGSLFTGNNIDTIGNDDESVGIQGIYQGSESDGYYPGSMMYHPFYNGTVNGESVTFANLGNNNYLEYRGGSSTPYKISVTWNPFPNVNIQLDESLNGNPVGKFDITSFAYGSNTYSGDYFHYIGHTKAGVESRFSISGAYSPN